LTLAATLSVCPTVPVKSQIRKVQGMCGRHHECMDPASRCSISKVQDFEKKKDIVWTIPNANMHPNQLKISFQIKSIKEQLYTPPPARRNKSKMIPIDSIYIYIYIYHGT
jgi:hypothetical protein